VAERLARLAPLAEALRPRRFDDVVGQEHLAAPGAALRRLAESGRLGSSILWGPAGTGKTTLARIAAETAGYELEGLSAVSAGVREVREALERARQRLAERGVRTALFIDEVHRFNKSQQDLLLPVSETGAIVLIGATTENPFFEVNAALMSRCTLWRLTALRDEDLEELCRRGARLRGAVLGDGAAEALVASAEGDARAALTTLDTAVVLADAGPEGAGEVVVTREHVALARDGRLVHQSRDTHYDQISAFIKSVRGSDPDAALYWMVALLEAGESARFLARRLVILASEDVGLADSSALVLAQAAAQAVEFVGLPEARLTLAHATLALALAPKSNSATRALAATEAALRAGSSTQVPTALRDAHYRGAASLGHGVGYQYPHDAPSGWVDQQYLPDDLVGLSFYEPSTHGREDALARAWRQRRSSDPDSSRTPDQDQDESPDPGPNRSPVE
jgi:putative ATPase